MRRTLEEVAAESRAYISTYRRIRCPKEEGLLAILALFFFLDGVYTVWLVQTGRAVEASPIMGYYLNEAGAGAFLLVRMLFIATIVYCGIWFTTVLKPRYPASRWRLLVGIYTLLYPIFYVASVLWVNLSM